MKKNLFLTAFILLLFANFSLPGTVPTGSDKVPQPANQWQSPPDDWLQVLYSPQYFDVWTAPGGDYLLLADPVLYPPLAELAAPMHKLAGMRVNPANNGFQGEHGGTSPRLGGSIMAPRYRCSCRREPNCSTWSGPPTAGVSRSPSG
jgi:hypothetical protein